MKRLILLLAVVFGCQTAGSVPVGMTPEQVSSEQETVEMVIDQLAVAWNEGDFKKYCSLWADSSKLITRNGNVHNIRTANIEERAQHIANNKASVGNIDYSVRSIKLESPTEASVSAEYTCYKCKDGGIGKASVRLEFVKQGGQWLVMKHDMSR